MGLQVSPEAGLGGTGHGERGVHVTESPQARMAYRTADEPAGRRVRTAQKAAVEASRSCRRSGVLRDRFRPPLPAARVLPGRGRNPEEADRDAQEGRHPERRYQRADHRRTRGRGLGLPAAPAFPADGRARRFCLEELRLPERAGRPQVRRGQVHALCRGQS